MKSQPIQFFKQNKGDIFKTLWWGKHLSQIVPILKEKINLTTLKLRISIHQKYHKESENANFRVRDVCKAFDHQRISIHYKNSYKSIRKRQTTQILNGQRDLKSI